MSKILDAICTGGQVKVGDTIVQEAVINSEGVGDSTGTLFMEDDKVKYIAKTSPDLKTTLTKLVDALTQTATALTQTASGLGAIDVKPTGGTGSASTPVAASNISAITSAVSSINTAKADLATLKDNLK